jgi:nucleoside-diphosphate-sugar epimerase
VDYMGHDLIVQRVLVTGAAGYLGKSVLDKLRRAGITGVCTTTRSEDPFPCDLREFDAVQSMIEQTCPDTIIHCAACVPKNDAGYSDEEAARDSLRMVTSLLATQPRHIVFPSTMTVYRAETRLPVREEDTTADLIGYAKGKKAAEDALLSAKEIKATVLRLPGLFGAPRQNGFIYNTALAFAENRVPTLPAEPPLWAAMHVDDAAELCVRAILRESPESIVANAGYPGRMSLCSVLRDLARLFGRPAPECDAPEFEMDLSRLECELGLSSKQFAHRLQEVAAWARQQAHPGLASEFAR